MKASARILSIPDSMKDRFDLVDGQLIKKKNSVVKKYKQSKQSVGVRGILAVAALVLGSMVWGAIASIDDADILYKACQSSIKAGNYEGYVDLDCANY